jgi:serine/threonine-protein kinase HipA
MPTSESSPIPEAADVWFWLPGAVEPVHAGRLEHHGGITRFAYEAAYLAAPSAIPLPGMPLKSGWISPAEGHVIPAVFRDAAPDYWGRRVLAHCGGRDPDDLDEVEVLLATGSDRIGALDFQAVGQGYQPREAEGVSLKQFLEAALAVQKGEAVADEMEEPLRRAVGVGGARPKTLVSGNGYKMIAKFPSVRDGHSAVRGEFVAMRLAALAGLDVASVELEEVAGREVLLVDRFDRTSVGPRWARRAVVSGLTLLGLPEHQARYASYEGLAQRLRDGCVDPEATLCELFGRMTFNILIGNTDDHARNHAAFWDGRHLALTPAYDIDPRPRMSREANQAMAVHGTSRQSSIALALKAAPSFLLSGEQAEQIVRQQVEIIRDYYPDLVRAVGMSKEDSRKIQEGAILRDHAFEGVGPELSRLVG